MPAKPVHAHCRHPTAGQGKFCICLTSVYTKSKQQKSWQKQIEVSPFSFCLCPTKSGNDVLLGTGGAKAQCPISK
jgi:hypothetical protein